MRNLPYETSSQLGDKMVDICHSRLHKMPSHLHQPQTRTEELLLQPVGERMERWVGIVCGAIGIALGSLVLWLAVVALTRGRPPIGVWVVMAVVGALAYFFTAVGYRLVRRIPNRYGSILSPRAWSVLTVVFFGGGAIGGYLSIIAKDYRHLDGVASAMLTALLSFGAASHFRRKSTRQGDAQSERPERVCDHRRVLSEADVQI